MNELKEQVEKDAREYADRLRCPPSMGPDGVKDTAEHCYLAGATQSPLLAKAMELLRMVMYDVSMDSCKPDFWDRTLAGIEEIREAQEISK